MLPTLIKYAKLFIITVLIFIYCYEKSKIQNENNSKYNHYYPYYTSSSITNINNIQH